MLASSEQSAFQLFSYDMALVTTGAMAVGLVGSFRWPRRSARQSRPPSRFVVWAGIWLIAGGMLAIVFSFMVTGEAFFWPQTESRASGTWSVLAIGVANFIGTDGLLHSIKQRITNMRLVTCPACNGVDTLRVQGTGERVRRNDTQSGVFCSHTFADTPPNSCGFVCQASICTLPRLRFTLLASSSHKERTWGATMCRGVVAEPTHVGTRFAPIITPRSDQLNASRIDIPGRELYNAELNSTETPTAVLGLRNNWPLVMTCQDNGRWRRSSTLVILSPWELERRVWVSANLTRADRGAIRSLTNGVLLPLDLGGDLGQQLHCLEDIRSLIHPDVLGDSTTRLQVPVAIVVGKMKSDTPIGSESLETTNAVKSRVATVIGGPIAWFTVPVVLLRVIGSTIKDPRIAFDMTHPLTWLINQNGLRTQRQIEP